MSAPIAKIALLGSGTVGLAVLHRLAEWQGSARGAQLQLVYAANTRLALHDPAGLDPVHCASRPGVRGGVDQDPDALRSKGRKRVTARFVTIAGRMGKQPSAVQRIETGRIPQRQSGVGGIDQPKLPAAGKFLPFRKASKHGKPDGPASKQGDIGDRPAH